MNSFDEEFDELDKDQFEQWLDSVNESGDPARDEEYYNKEMEKQENKYLGDLSDREVEMMQSAEFPEFRVLGKDYICTYSVN